LAKKVQTRSKTKNESGAVKFSLDNYIPENKQRWLGLGLLMVLIFLFFSPVFFQGKVFQSGDLITANAFQTLIKTTNHQMLWNPYVFCGMPSQPSGVGYVRWFDIVNTTYATVRETFGHLFDNKTAENIFTIIVLAITSFLFMRSRKASVLISVFVSSAIVFSTGIVVFLFIGHITKLYTISIYPLVFMLLFRFQERIRFLEVIVFIIAIGFLIASWHVQVIFYSYFAFGLYFLYFIVSFLIKKSFHSLKQLGKSLSILVLATVIALLMSVDMYWQIYEYTATSTRGTKSIIEKTSGQDAETASGFYDYATSWSFSPGEVMTFVIPSFYGFGDMTYSADGQDVEANTYFGQMPFVDVAMYMGVIVFFLGLFAMYADRKNPFVRFLTILVIISLLISFGKTFSPLYDLMYYHFPGFNKFRVPSMILILVQLSFPMLAGFGLMKIVELREEKNSISVAVLKYAAIAFSALFVVALLGNSVLSSWFAERVADSTPSNRAQYLGQYSSLMSGVFIKDTLIAFVLVATMFWLSYLYTQSKLSRDLLLIVILCLSLFDLLRISSRGAKFIDKQDYANIFDEPAYINIIKQQHDKDPFRIINLKEDGYGSVSQNSNFNEYFLVQDLHGYSGIKPRTYQDYADVVTPANPTLWRMLNVKYVVLDKTIQYPGLTLVGTGNKTAVYKNEEALPRAYFVNKVEVKKSLEMLQAVKENKFDPHDVAYSTSAITVDKPDSTAFVQIQRYDNDSISIHAKASGNNFMFLGDTYYAKGWTATIDGKETKIYEVNHGFRGIIIPQGVHEVKLTFLPQSYVIGKTVSLVVNLLLIAGLIVGIFLEKKKKNKAVLAA
jgi:hypothetical protein